MLLATSVPQPATRCLDRARIVILAAVLVVSACMPIARRDPTPSPIPPGTSPREAILGRPAHRYRLLRDRLSTWSASRTTSRSSATS